MGIKMNIKTKNPKLPTQKQIDKFNALLVRTKLADHDTSFLSNLLEAYKHGVRLIRAEFSGSGDSGDMWNFQFCDHKSNYIDTDNVAVDSNPIRDKVFEIFEQSVECDWVNNDGGGGVLELKLPSLDVRVTSFYNETVSHEMPEQTKTLNPLK